MLIPDHCSNANTILAEGFESSALRLPSLPSPPSLRLSPSTAQIKHANKREARTEELFQHYRLMAVRLYLVLQFFAPFLVAAAS